MREEAELTHSRSLRPLRTQDGVVLQAESFDLVNAVKLLLTRVAVGRMLLHLGCIVRGGRVLHHLEGIKRELRRCCALVLPVRQPQERDLHPPGNERGRGRRSRNL